MIILKLLDITSALGLNSDDIDFIVRLQFSVLITQYSSQGIPRLLTRCICLLYGVDRLSIWRKYGPHTDMTKLLFSTMH